MKQKLLSKICAPMELKQISFVDIFSRSLVHSFWGGFWGNSFMKIKNTSWFSAIFYYSIAGYTPRWDQARSEMASCHLSLRPPLGHISVHVTSRACLNNLFWHILDTWPNHCSWDLYSKKWLDIQGFTYFATLHFVTKCHCELFVNIPYLLLVLEIAHFQSSHKIHDCRWGSDQRPI